MLEREVREEPDENPERTVEKPTAVWMMLGLILVVGFIVAVVWFLRPPPPFMSAPSRYPPAVRMPAPPKQVAPARPTPNPEPTDIR